MAEMSNSFEEVETEEKKRPIKRSRAKGIVAFGVVVLVVAAGAFAYVRLVLAGNQSTDDAALAANQVVVSAEMLDQIASMSADEGEMVSRGQVLALLDDSTLKAQENQANFKETQVPLLRPGDPATVTVDAFPGRTFSGRVESIGAVTASQFALIPADNASGNFTKVTQRVPVKITLEDRPEAKASLRLLPGMSAEVRVKTGKE